MLSILIFILGIVIIFLTMFEVYMVASIVFEKRRKKILKQYILTDHQAKFRVSSGQAVYAESEQDNAFVMLSGINNTKVHIKDLFSGRYSICDISLFLNTFNSLTENGYKFYASESYDVLLKKGFRVSYER